MGTNYYARIIPTKKRKDEIIKAIENNDFVEVKYLVNKTYGRTKYDYDDKNGFSGGEIHLGKRSAGWKFLWNPNWYKRPKGHMEWEEIEDGHKIRHFVDDGYDVFKYYNLTKKSIKKFIDRKDVEIYDEYGEKQDKEGFFQMALTWGYNENDKGWDGESYEEYEKSENTGCRTFSYYSDYCKFLEECGFKLNKYYTDFYSNGLRFATCTDFS